MRRLGQNLFLDKISASSARSFINMLGLGDKATNHCRIAIMQPTLSIVLLRA